MTSTEVGTAYVTIIPSAKGFARALQKSIAKEFAGAHLDKAIADALGDRPVKLPVQPDIDPQSVPDELPVRRGREPKLPVRLDPLVRAMQDDVRRQLRALTRDVSAQIEVTADTADLRTEIADAVAQIEDTLAAEVPTEPAGRREYEQRLRQQVAAVTARVRARVDTDVHIDDEAAGWAGRGAGKQIAGGVEGGLADFLPSAITKPIESLVNNPVLSSAALAIGIPLGTMAASAIGAGITAAFVGGAGIGAIGIGALILKEEPRVVAAATRLVDKLKKVLFDAAQPLVGPIVESLGMLERFISDLATGTDATLGVKLRDIFEAIAPAIRPLTEGLIGFIEGALPGILDLVEASVPMLTDLASTLPRLGEDVGAFFGIIADAAPGASMFLRDLLNVIGLVILTVGQLIAWLSEAYAAIRTAIDGPLEILRQAVLGWESNINDIIGFLDELRRFVAAVWRAVRIEIGEAVQTMRQVPGRLRAALGNTGRLLYNAGRAIVQGLIDGLRSMLGPLEGALNWITNQIPNWKGPLDRDRRLLEPAGQAIMGGLIRGIDSQVPALRSELGTVTDIVAGTPLTASWSPGSIAAPSPPAPALELRFAGDAPDSFIGWLRDNIRINYGGSAQTALGS